MAKTNKKQVQTVKRPQNEEKIKKFFDLGIDF